ncbi:hypothetical protein IGK25_002606 [Enterococcus sp. DIV1614a]
MENREKIIQLLEDPLISGYGIEKNVKWSTLFCELSKIQKTCRKKYNYWGIEITM